jgi:hypothetical protein
LTYDEAIDLLFKHYVNENFLENEYREWETGELQVTYDGEL